MAKMITNAELAQIITGILTDPESNEIDSMEGFANFTQSLAIVVADYCGGTVTGHYRCDDPDADFGESYYVAIRRNDSLPEDGGVWKTYDLEGEL